MQARLQMTEQERIIQIRDEASVMQAYLQMTERERIIKIRKPSLDNSFVPTHILLLKILLFAHLIVYL